MKKKIFALMLALVMVLGIAAACSPPPEVPVAPPADTPADTPETEDEDPPPPPAEPTGVTLEFWSNMGGTIDERLQEVIAMFTAETGIQVDYSAPAADYEALMRTRMATNDLPDVFTTHGWAVIRYGTFLRPLNDQPWYGQVNDQIRGIVTDADGNLMVLPVDMDMAGMNYNKDIMAELGVNVADIRTWADFEAVCEMVLAAGYTPFMLGGLDNWTLGQIADWVIPSILITYENDNHDQALLDGTFDWNNWGVFYDKMADWRDRGFFNEDVLTADFATITAEMGRGNVAFGFFGNWAAVDAAGQGPANWGMMAIPAFFPGDEPSLIAGERLSVGVWNETPHEAEALMFLEFLARPEIMTMLAEANASPAGFTGVEVDLGFLTEDVEGLAHIRTFPYFDRVWLPSGGWDLLCDNVFGILNRTLDREGAIAHMENGVAALR